VKVIRFDIISFKSDLKIKKETKKIFIYNK